MLLFYCTLFLFIMPDETQPWLSRKENRKSQKIKVVFSARIEKRPLATPSEKGSKEFTAWRIKPSSWFHLNGIELTLPPHNHKTVDFNLEKINLEYERNEMIYLISNDITVRLLRTRCFIIQPNFHSGLQLP